MTRKSIYGPARLLNIPNFSEVVVGLLEREHVGNKPEDPRLQTIQTILSEFSTSYPAIIREWKYDELRAESTIRQQLLKQQIEATDNEISVIMTRLVRESEQISC